MHLIFGCGYLGQRVAALWQQQSVPVAALTRSHSDLLAARGIEAIIGDVLQPGSLTELPAAESILYAIGFDRTTGASYRDVYVTGLANVLAALPRPPRQFIYVSSTSVYGHTQGEGIDETARTEPCDESGKVILEAEQLLRLRVPGAIVLRFAGIYGPGRLLRRAAIEKGTPLHGDPEKWLNLIHVDDGARAVVAADKLAQPGSLYHVSDGHPVRRRDFYSLLAELLRAPPARFESPDQGNLLPIHESNRRILNQRMRAELQVEPHFPSFREGLPASLT